MKLNNEEQILTDILCKIKSIHIIKNPKTRHFVPSKQRLIVIDNGFYNFKTKKFQSNTII